VPSYRSKIEILRDIDRKILSIVGYETRMYLKGRIDGYNKVLAIFREKQKEKA
jgi:hypothetical protein